MRCVLSMMVMVACFSAACGQIRPPGWVPVPPGADSVPLPVLASVSHDTLPLPVFDTPVMADEPDHTIRVNVPDDAVLVIDDKPVQQQTGRLRLFKTRHTSGAYTIRAEVNRNGTIYRSTRTVQAGDADVSFPELEDVGQPVYRTRSGYIPMSVGAFSDGGACVGGT